MKITVCIVAQASERKGISLEKIEHENVKEIIFFDEKSDDLKSEIIKTLQSDVLVTVGDWFKSEHCNCAVTVVRLVGMEIISQQRFSEYVKTIND